MYFPRFHFYVCVQKFKWNLLNSKINKGWVYIFIRTIKLLRQEANPSESKKCSFYVLFSRLSFLFSCFSSITSAMFTVQVLIEIHCLWTGGHNRISYPDFDLISIDLSLGDDVTGGCPDIVLFFFPAYTLGSFKDSFSLYHVFCSVFYDFFQFY